MKRPDKEKFIEVLTFLKDYCEIPKKLVCAGCLLCGGEYHGCLFYSYPEDWDIDEIVKSIYEKDDYWEV